MTCFGSKEEAKVMSQLIACQNAHGIILATDSVAAVFSPAGELSYEKVDRMLQLGPQAAILTGGAADGDFEIPMRTP